MRTTQLAMPFGTFTDDGRVRKVGLQSGPFQVYAALQVSPSLHPVAENSFRAGPFVLVKSPQVCVTGYRHSFAPGN